MLVRYLNFNFSRAVIHLTARELFFEKLTTVNTSPAVGGGRVNPGKLQIQMHLILLSWYNQYARLKEGKLNIDF